MWAAAEGARELPLPAVTKWALCGLDFKFSGFHTSVGFCLLMLGIDQMWFSKVITL